MLTRRYSLAATATTPAHDHFHASLNVTPERVALQVTKGSTTAPVGKKMADRPQCAGPKVVVPCFQDCAGGGDEFFCSRGVSEALVRATAGAGGKYIFANALFLKPCSASIFLPFLEKRFPHLVGDYRRRYQKRTFLSSSYRKRLSQLISQLRRKYGIGSDYDRYRGKSHPLPPHRRAIELVLKFESAQELRS